MKRIFLPIFIFVLLFSFLFFAPRINKVLATTATLTAAADTMIQSDYPDSGYGESTLINTSRTTTAKSRILARFDLGGVPSNATVSSATFSIYFSSCGRLSLAVDDLNIARITGAWSELGESTATWNTHKNKFDTGSALHKTAPCGSTGKYLNYDIKTFVDNWRNGTWPNYGLGLYGDETATEQWKKIFYSKEDSANKPPKLVINYTVPGQPAAGDGTTSPGATGDNQDIGVTTADQGAGKQTTTGTAATSASKKVTTSADETKVSWTRIAVLAALTLLLIALVAGYIIYRRRKAKLLNKAK